MESDAISERVGEWGMIWVGGGDACMMIPDPSYYIENDSSAPKPTTTMQTLRSTI
jgi:hypothetical protein